MYENQFQFHQSVLSFNKVVIITCDDVYQIIWGGRSFGRGPVVRVQSLFLENQAERRITSGACALRVQPHNKTNYY